MWLLSGAQGKGRERERETEREKEKKKKKKKEKEKEEEKKKGRERERKKTHKQKNTAKKTHSCRKKQSIGIDATPSNCVPQDNTDISIYLPQSMRQNHLTVP